FVLDRLPVAVVAVGTALTLWATGVLDLNQALAGFGDPAVIFIASLFVVSESLDATGVTAWGGELLVGRVADGRTRLPALPILLAAGLTALISVNGAVAALLPVVVVMAVRLREPASQLLLPLAFAAHAGSLLTLSGSPVNVIASEFSDDAGAGSFGYFSFALVGVPLVAGTIAIVVLFGERLVPTRSPRAGSRDFSEHARTLVDQYGLEADGVLLTRRSGLVEIVIPPRSELVGDLAFCGMVPRGATSWCSPSSAGGRTCRARRRSRSATPCCSRAPGARSRSTSTTRRCWSWTSPGSSGGRCRSARARRARWWCS